MTGDIRWGSVSLIALCQSIQSLVIGGMALFLPLIRDDLGLTYTQVGAIVSVSTLVYAIMQIPSGYLADRLDPRNLFAAGLAGTCVLAFVFALLDDYELILANQALSGVFRALAFAPGLLLIAALFPAQRRATALGIYVAFGFSSNVILSLVGPWVVDYTGWRAIFGAFAVGGLAVVAAYWFLAATPPARHPDGHLPLRELLVFLRGKVMWALVVIQYVRLAVVYGVTYWLPTLIVDEKSYSLATAGAVAAVAAACTAPSNLVGGYVSDRLGNPLLVIGLSLVVLAVTTSLIPHLDSLALLFVVVAVNAAFFQLYFGPLFSIPIGLFGQRVAGIASGYGNFFANLGGFTFVYVIGVIKDATGSFAAGFHAVSALCLVSLAATFALRRLTATPAAV